MPLAPTARREPVESKQKRRRASWLVALGLSLLLLVGCAEGTSRDAERGRERDRQRTSVVDELQSTRTAQFISGSPEASATPDD
jgi:hypothetical protein